MDSYDMIESKRGINTNTEPKNEIKAKTITNRLGQKSITLRRIDDKKRWAGYPGLSGTAQKIARLISKHKFEYYIEPFAGAAKVYQELFKLVKLKNHYFVLNDKSEFIYGWLLDNFFFEHNHIRIRNLDFKDIIKRYNWKDSIFLIDYPWFKGSYEQSFSCFDRKSVKEYDKEVLDLCKTIKGKFIITTRKENNIMLKSGYNHKLIKSEYVVSGKYPKVLLTTNLDLK